MPFTSNGISQDPSFEPNVTLVIGKLEQEDRSITFVNLQKEQLLSVLLLKKLKKIKEIVLS